MLLWEYRENANNTKGLKVFQRSSFQDLGISRKRQLPVCFFV